MKKRRHWMQRGNRREGRWRGRLNILGSITDFIQPGPISPQDCLQGMIALPPLIAKLGRRAKFFANSSKVF